MNDTWLTQNKAGLSMFAVAVLVLVGLMSAQGCNLYDNWKMNVPTEVQKATGAAPRINLSEAPDLRTEYIEKTHKTLEAFDANYTDAAFFADLAAWGISLGLDTANQDGGAAFRGGAALVGVLTGLGGLMVSKPGDKKKAEQAKAALSDGELSEDDMRMIQIGEGDSLQEIKAKLKPKKSSISMDMLDTANTYDDKVALIRMLVAEDSGRVANVLKGMIKVN